MIRAIVNRENGNGERAVVIGAIVKRWRRLRKGTGVGRRKNDAKYNIVRRKGVVIRAIVKYLRVGRR